MAHFMVGSWSKHCCVFDSLDNECWAFNYFSVHFAPQTSYRIVNKCTLMWKTISFNDVFF